MLFSKFYFQLLGVNRAVQLPPVRQHPAHRQETQPETEFLRSKRHQRRIAPLRRKSRRSLSASKVDFFKISVSNTPLGLPHTQYSYPGPPPPSPCFLYSHIFISLYPNK
jgi:hypothetical protein